MEIIGLFMHLETVAVTAVVFFVLFPGQACFSHPTAFEVLLNQGTPVPPPPPKDAHPSEVRGGRGG